MRSFILQGNEGRKTYKVVFSSKFKNFPNKNKIKWY